VAQGGEFSVQFANLFDIQRNGLVGQRHRQDNRSSPGKSKRVLPGQRVEGRARHSVRAAFVDGQSAGRGLPALPSKEHTNRQIANQGKHQT
jgi:hypothetical protein